MNSSSVNSSIQTNSKSDSLASLFLELSKARLTALVLVTTLTGFWAGSPHGIDAALLFWTMIGTAGAAAAANSLNQWRETELDAKMKRTRNRPLPAGRLTRALALQFSLIIGTAGVALLYVFVNPLTAFLGALNIAIYVLIYTPMKTRSSLCTLVGAVCGAIPPMMGWTAATGTLEAGAWILGAILFVWQIPHFLALAWMYKDDYARGGFRMLPVVDPQNRLTPNISALYSIALIPIGAAYFLSGDGGWIYLLGSFTLGGAMTAMGFQFAASKSYQDARRLFFMSLIYLPLLMALMAIDSGPADNSGAAIADRPGAEAVSAGDDSSFI